jgi:anti-anti-sigma regulatory factor
MINMTDYPHVPLENFEQLELWGADEKQLAEIKSNIESKPKGGINVEMKNPPKPDSVVKAVFRISKGDEKIDATGVVRNVFKMGIKSHVIIDFSHVKKIESEEKPLEPTVVIAPATTVSADGPTLIIKGELGLPAHDGFIHYWEKTLRSTFRELFINLSEVTRISTMGVGLLIGAHMEALKEGKSLTVKVPADFQRILAVAGADKVINFVYIDQKKNTAIIGKSRHIGHYLDNQKRRKEEGKEKSFSEVLAESNAEIPNPVAIAEALFKSEVEKLKS